MGRFTKFASLAVACVLIAGVFCACADTLEQSGVSEVSENIEPTAVENAQALINADYLIANIFVSGLLETGGYPEFADIRALLDTTYVPGSGAAESYLAFPGYGEAAVYSDGGKTAYNYLFKDTVPYINPEDITVTESGVEGVMNIDAGGYRLTMSFIGGRWLLGGSIYLMYAEERDAEELDFAFDGMGIGSAKALSGNILLVEVFVSDTVSAFSEESIAKFSAKIDSVTDFLRESAASYGTALSFDKKQLYFTHREVIEFSEEEPYRFELAMGTTAFGTLTGYIEGNMDTSGYDGYFAVLCSDKPGAGYAGPFTYGDAERFFTERSVLLAEDSEGLLAVNILKLFGAAELTDSAQTDLMNKYIKNEIMAGAELDAAAVSPLTAYRSGMTKRLPAPFRVFYTEPEPGAEISEEGSALD